MNKENGFGKHFHIKTSQTQKGKQVKVLNYGSLNIDYVYSVDHIAQIGETILSDSLKTFCGGKGLNQSIALAKAGVAVNHAGLIGEDGDILLDICKEYGVDTTYIKKVPAQGGHTIIQVDKEGRNNIILYGGTNQMQSREYIDKVLSDFTAGDYLLLQNEINQLDYIIDKAYEKEMRIVLNPSPFDDKLDKCDFSKIYLFLLNEVEGAQFTGESQPDSMIQMFREKLPDSKAVLTLGSEGAVYFDSKVEIRQPIFKTEVIDTTAAGDTFTGFFLAGLLKGFDISETLKIASKAASIAVSRAGAVNSIPMLNEVMESFEKNEKGREREK